MLATPFRSQGPSIDAFDDVLEVPLHDTFDDGLLHSVSPSTQPLESSIQVPLVLDPIGDTFDDVSQTTVSAIASTKASSSSHWTMGVDLMQHFFLDDPSFHMPDEECIERCGGPKDGTIGIYCGKLTV